MVCELDVVQVSFISLIVVFVHSERLLWIVLKLTLEDLADVPWLHARSFFDQVTRSRGALAELFCVPERIQLRVNKSGPAARLSDDRTLRLFVVKSLRLVVRRANQASLNTLLVFVWLLLVVNGVLDLVRGHRLTLDQVRRVYHLVLRRNLVGGFVLGRRHLLGLELKQLNLRYLVTS